MDFTSESRTLSGVSGSTDDLKVGNGGVRYGVFLSVFVMGRVDSIEENMLEEPSDCDVKSNVEEPVMNRW